MTLRKARMSDIPGILRLINGYAAQGLMLPRNGFELAENIRDFTVAAAADAVHGCAALHFYGPSMAEVRSLAVDPAMKKAGLGRKLMEAVEEEARLFGLDLLFAFTYVPDFFARLGYRQVDRSELPLKAWKDCLRCPKFQACDEIAVLKWLKPEAERTLRASDPLADALIPLPVVRGN
ncbi:MAG: acetyltransferase [Bryobacteraceae bacterium]|nr:MAG: acetyltransferase [Bryobacteraceae bacterium]